MNNANTTTDNGATFPLPFAVAAIVLTVIISFSGAGSASVAVASEPTAPKARIATISSPAAASWDSAAVTGNRDSFADAFGLGALVIKAR